MTLTWTFRPIREIRRPTLQWKDWRLRLFHRVINGYMYLGRVSFERETWGALLLKSEVWTSFFIVRKFFHSGNWKWLVKLEDIIFILVLLTVEWLLVCICKIEKFWKQYYFRPEEILSFKLCLLTQQKQLRTVEPGSMHCFSQSQLTHWRCDCVSWFLGSLGMNLPTITLTVFCASSSGPWCRSHLPFSVGRWEESDRFSQM